MVRENRDLTTITTPVHPAPLGKLLKEIKYPKKLTEHIIQGFMHGFKISYEGERKQVILTNHPSAMTRSSAVLQKLNKEVKAGRLASLFLKVPRNGFITNPLGLVPKTNELGLDLPEMFPNDESSYRLITDLKRSGVNAGIPPEKAKVKYTKFDQAIEMCLHTGKGCYMV